MADGPADNLQELPEQIQRMLDHYRLVDNPFGKAVDAKVFSRAGNRARVAGEIERLFRSTATDCLLIAPEGGGKSTLARQVARQLGADWRVAWIDGWQILDPVDLVRELGAQLRLGHKVEGTAAEVSRRIAELVATKADGGENGLLVVQHADQLTPEMQRWLRSLGRHGGRPETRLRQLWFAESAQAIDEAGNAHHWCTITLDPLTDAQAMEYLGDRFAAAGRFEGLPIEENEVARLNRIAGGWPGRLNRVARDYLVAANKRALEWQPATGLLYALIGIAALIALTTMAVRYLSTQPETNTADQPAPEDHEPASDQAGINPAIDEPDDGRQQSASESEPASISASEGDEVAPVSSEQSPDTDTATVVPESIPSDDDDTEPTPAGEGDAEPTLPDEGDAGLKAAGEQSVYTVQLAGARNRENLVALRDDLDVRVDTRIARTTLEDQPWYVLIAGRHESVSQARDAIDALPPEIRSRSPWPRALSELEVLESTTSPSQGALDVPDEDVAAGEEGNGGVSAPSAPFTLQLVGVRERSSLEDLVSDLENTEQYEIVSTTFEGRPWYILTHGRYETEEAARSAIERLPEELQRYSPWPKRVSDSGSVPP